MKSDALKGAFAVFLCAALIGTSGCGGSPEVNAETLASATTTPAAVQPASETTTTFSTTTTTAATAPEVQPDSSVFPFKPGVWLDRSGLRLNNGRESSGIYFIFETGGGRTLGLDTGTGLSFDAEKNGEDVVLHFGSSDDNTPVRFRVIDENTVDMTFLDDNTTERLTFVTDVSENFTFYPEEYLIELAKQFYAAKHEGHVPTKAEASSEDDNTVLIQLYDDESYSLNATSAWYFIDRFTGKGKDIDGREIDLTSVSGSQNSSSSPITGVWWLKDKDYGGEIWVIQDNKAGYVTELINGIGYDFTYEIYGSAVVFSYHGTTAEGSETFTLGDGEIIIDKSRKLTFLTGKSDGFVVYSNVDLANKAAEYYASTHDGHFPAKAVYSIEYDDLVRIRLLNDDSRSSDEFNDWYFLIEDEKDESDWTYTEIARYTVDRFTGKGKDIDGREVDLTTTEETAENTAADENNTYGG